MRIHPQVVASHGGACNLSAVALRLAAVCDPRLASTTKLVRRTCAVACRLSLADETRVACTADEAVAAKLDSDQDKEDWGFVCECFYITS